MRGGSLRLPLSRDARDRVPRDLGDEAVQVVAFIGHAKDGHACSSALVNSIINKDLISPNTTVPVVQGFSVADLHADDAPSLVEVHPDPEGRTIYLSLTAPDDPAALLSLSQQLGKQDLKLHSATLAAAENERTRALLFLFLVSTTVVLVQASSGVDPHTLQLLRLLELLKADAVRGKQTCAAPAPARSSADTVPSLLDRFVSSARVPELLLLLQPSLPLDQTARRLNRVHKHLEQQTREMFKIARLHSVGDPRATHPDYTHLFRVPEKGFVFIHPRDTGSNSSTASAHGGNACTGLDPVISLLDKFSLPLDDMMADATGMDFDVSTAAPATAVARTTPTATTSLSEEVPQLAANLHHHLRAHVQAVLEGNFSDTFAAKSTSHADDNDDEDGSGRDDAGLGGRGLFSSAALFVLAANALYRHVVVDACPAVVQSYSTPKPDDGATSVATAVDEEGAVARKSGDDADDKEPEQGQDAGIEWKDEDGYGDRPLRWFERMHRDADRACTVLEEYSEASCQRALSLGTNQYRIDLPPVYDEQTHGEHVARAAAAFMAAARGPRVFCILDTLIQQCEQEWTNGRRQCKHMSLTHHRCVHPIHLTPRDAQRQVDIEGKDVMTHESGVSFRCACVCGRSQRVVPDAFDIHEINGFVVEAKCCQHTITSTLPLAIHNAAKNASTAATASATTTTTARTTGTPPPSSDDLLADEDDTATPRVFGGRGGDDMPVAPKVSWPPACFCLYRLGDGTSYVSKRGLEDQRGFLPNAHHLIPCVIYERDTQRPQGQTRRQRQKDRVQVARLYVGYEYETQSGKRFIAHGKDATVRVSTAGKVQGSARKSLDTPMPICMSVPKKSVKEQAQLVRLHVVVPNAPLAVQLQPTVQIKRNMGLALTTRAVVLPPNGHYVLHFPRVFAWHGRHILFPTTPEAQKHFVLRPNPLIVEHQPG